MFLPFVLTLYYITPRRFRNLTLFIVDLVFYAWGEPWLVILMLFSILLNYTSGILIGINREKKGLARFIFILSVILNLGLLGFFKYAGFIGETLNMVMPFLNIPILEIALPIGISFYTFQTMSYTIDVYKNTVKVQKNIITFGTYVSLFPQLIAGPIVRYEDVAEQLMHRKETLQGFTDGVKLFLIGLSKKVLLANEMGNLWDAVRESGTQSGALGSWVGIIAYTFQIYFDFCGYSEMAMGLGKMFGFDFLKNFDYPYISKNITEFWRRWHISLGTWFREYVYIPLGGNRKGKIRQYVNLFLTMLIGGLWHGAGFTYVIWGAIHGVALVIHKMCMPWLKRIPDNWAVKLLSGLLTFTTVMLAFVFFRAESVAEATTIIGGIFTNFDLAYLPPFVSVRYVWCIMLVLLLVAHFVPCSIYAAVKNWFVESFWLVKLVVFVIVVQLVLQFATSDVTPFIYAQY